MSFRRRANRRSDKRRFSRTAQRTHKRNIPSRPMRGGIRL